MGEISLPSKSPQIGADLRRAFARAFAKERAHLSDVARAKGDIIALHLNNPSLLHLASFRESLSQAVDEFEQARRG